MNFQLKLIQQTAADLLPFGKVPPVGGPDLDTDDEGRLLTYFCRYGEIVTEDHNSHTDPCIYIFYIIIVGNDESDDSESRDEEEEEEEEPFDPATPGVEDQSMDN